MNLKDHLIHLPEKLNYIPVVTADILLLEISHDLIPQHTEAPRAPPALQHPNLSHSLYTMRLLCCNLNSSFLFLSTTNLITTYCTPPCSHLLSICRYESLLYIKKAKFIHLGHRLCFLGAWIFLLCSGLSHFFIKLSIQKWTVPNIAGFAHPTSCTSDNTSQNSVSLIHRST